MKAIVCTKYGPPEVLQLQEVAKPTPKNNEVLIRVSATTVTATDCEMRRGESFIGRLFLGLKKPRKRFRIPGIELAGEVEAVGSNVTRFKVGDSIFGATTWRMSCCAEYTCLPEKIALAHKPDNLTYEEAAAVGDGALTALHFLKGIAHIQRGQKILLNGASGSVGTYAVQLARYFGAEVTGICSTANVAMVKSLGADRVVDYTQEDFTRSDETYDIIFDTVGKTSFSRCKGLLKQNGIFLETTVGVTIFLQMLWTSVFGSKRAVLGSAGTHQRKEDLIFLKELVEAGTIHPVIDRRYSLEEIVEAHRYVDQGHKKGNVVITVAQ